VRRRLAIIQLLRHREPGLLVAGQTVSNFGDGVSLVALTLLVVDTTGSTSKLAWFAAARMTPLVIFLLVGGAVVDRFSRRDLLFISDAARAVLTIGLTVLLALHILSFVELLIYGFAFGIFDAVFMPAITAITPEIVPDDLLPAMNAVRPLANNVAGNMIGPAVGGMLAAWNTTWAIGVDASTFVLSATSLMLMRRTPRPARDQSTSMVSEIRAGLRYVRRTRWVWTTLSSVAVGNALVFTPMFVLVPFFLRHDLHTSKAVVGFTFAAAGASGALGALVAGNLKVPRRRVRVMWTYWTIASMTALAFGVATNFWQVALIPIVASPMMLMGNVVWESMIQSEVPRDLLGRVSSVDWFVSLGLSPVGIVAAGALSLVVGVRTYFVVASIVATVPGLVMLASRTVNAVDRDRLTTGGAEGPAPTAGEPVESPS
jgi:MFS family permease